MGHLNSVPPAVLEAPRGRAPKGLSSMRSQSTRVSRACAHCGAPFLAYPSAVASGRARYCSRSCLGSAQSAERTCDPLSRFWRHVSKLPGRSGCWEWAGTRKTSGYGQFRIGGRTVLAHRWLYRRLVRADLGRLDLDHLCRNRGCVRPEHLEPVSRRATS